MAGSTDSSSDSDLVSAAEAGDEEAQAVLAIAEDLRRQLEHSLEMIQALEEDLAATREQQKRAEALAVTRARELERVQADAAAAQRSNEGLVTELGASEEERAEAVKEIRRLVSASDIASDTVRTLNEQQQKQAREAEEAQRAAVARESRLKAAIGEIEQRLQTAERSLEQRTKDLDQAHALVDELSNERDSLLKRVADLERSRKALGKIHTSLADIRSRVLGDLDAQGQRKKELPTVSDQGSD